MGDRLKGKVAIVTGGGRGLGRAHCLALADEGAKVVVNDLGGEVDGTGAAKGPADEVVSEIKAKGGEAIANYGSVASYTDAEALIKAAIDTYGKLDILVNNAGILRDRMVFNMAEEEWDAVVAVHLKGHFNTVRHACSYFRQMWKEKKQGGRIINTASASGWGNLGQVNYSAVKEGIIGLTRTVALDMGRYGVTCNAIRPGAATRMTWTPELKAAMEKAKAAGVTGAAGAGMGDIASMAPEMVSPMVVYLATDAAANVNGQAFHCAGGRIELEALPMIKRGIYKEGIFTLDELDSILPGTLLAGLVNPSPAAE